MRVLAIILNYRTAELTERAIETALVALEPVQPSRLVVVDNDSGDGSYERLAAFGDRPEHRGRFEVVQAGRNGGFGAGNNVAIRRALASSEVPEYFYILNSDAFPEPNAIASLVAHLDGHPECGIVGSSIVGVDGTPHESAFRFPSVASEFEDAMKLGLISSLLRERRVTMPMPAATREVDWLAGASMLVRRRVFESVGLFDETFFLYFEETDLCRRAALAGFRAAYVIDSRVAHVGSASTGLNRRGRRTPTYWFDSRAHYFEKNHGRGYLAFADLARLIGGVTLRARSVVQRKSLVESPGFLSDLARHAGSRRLRRLRGLVTRRTPADSSCPASEPP